jgi:hypothetical protein
MCGDIIPVIVVGTALAFDFTNGFSRHRQRRRDLDLDTRDRSQAGP